MSLAETGSEPPYERPTALARAIELRSKGAAIVAGGTDYFPLRVARPLRDRGITTVLDLTGLADLRGIVEADDHFRLGALVTWTDIAEHPFPAWFDGLRGAAREVGGRQIQNRGTIGGNLCNASPAADGIPALLSLGAAVEVKGLSGPRQLPIEEFILGPRRTALRHDEILTAIIVPKPRYPSRAEFFKLGSRRYLVISLVMVAAVIEHEEGVIRSVRIAVGACSPAALRLRDLELALTGQALNPSIGDLVQPSHLQSLSPIDDPRASARYRLDAAMTILRRLLNHLGSGT